MNPFDWNGPEFLGFYLVLGVVSYWFLRFYVSYRERQAPIPKLKMSDPFQIAFLRGSTEREVRALREKQKIIPTYKSVDTCADEFVAYTPYYYSTYEEEDEVTPSAKKKVMIFYIVWAIGISWTVNYFSPQLENDFIKYVAYFPAVILQFAIIFYLWFNHDFHYKQNWLKF